MKIAILTCTTSNRKYLYDITNETKRNYIHNRKNIDFIFSDTFLLNKEWGIYWFKPQFIRKYIQNYDYILWMDDDAGIVDQLFDLNLFLSTNEKDILATVDENGINAGVFFLKNSKKSIELLDYMLSLSLEYKQLHWDQDAYINFIMKNLNVVDLLPGNIFNAHSHIYMNNNVINIQTKSTFIVHIGGGDIRKKYLLTNNLLDKVFTKL